jgi:hypothetical protein
LCGCKHLFIAPILSAKLYLIKLLIVTGSKDVESLDSYDSSDILPKFKIRKQVLDMRIVASTASVLEEPAQI